MWSEYVFCKSREGAFGNYLGGAFVDNAFRNLNAGLAVLNNFQLPEDTIAADLFYYLGQHYHLHRPTGWLKALNFFQRSLGARINAFGNTHQKVADTYNVIGRVYLYTLADYKNAEQYFQYALTILENLPVKNHFNLATVYFDLATANYNESDHDKAMVYAYQCMHIIDNNLTAYKQAFKEKCHALISNIFSDRKEFQLAIENMEKAIALNLQSGNLPDRMIYYNNLAQNYFLVNNLQQAAVYAKKVLLIKESSHTEDFGTYATSLLILARIKSLSGDLEVSKEYLRSAIASITNAYGEHFHVLTDLYYNLANFYRNESSYDSALLNYQRAIATSHRGTWSSERDVLANPNVRALVANPLNFEIMADKGGLLLSRYSQEGDTVFLAAALDAYLKADTLFTLHREGLGSQQARQLTSEKYNSVYEGLVECAWQNWRNRDTDFTRQLLITSIDKGKSKMHQDLLAEAVAKKTLNIPDSLVFGSRALSKQVAYYQQLQTNPTGLSSEDEFEVRRELFRLARAQEKNTVTIQEKYPAFAELKLGKTPASYAQIKDLTRDKHTLIINSFWSEQAVYLCGISGGYFDCQKIAVDSIRNVLKQFVESLQEYNNKTPPEKFNLDGYYLFQKLVAPFLSEKTSKIIFIPDGPLFQLPFETLPSCVSKARSFKHGCYLIESHIISYANNTQMAITYREPQRQPGSGVLGFSYSQTTVTNPVGAGSTVPELPGTAKEISVIRQMFDGVFLEGIQATESMFKKTAHHYDILHLGLHGQSNQDRIGLIFRNNSDSLDDGILYPYEIYGLDLNARLAVLSACSSGVGVLHEGEGLVSLASAFNHAGCPAVVMSLWDIADQQTSTLMQTFYQNIRAGLPADVALQEAKLRLLRGSNDNLAHPRYWGAFIITGEADQSFSSNTDALDALMILFAALLAIFLWLRRNTFKRLKRKIDHINLP